jgi:hypothetical protein
VGKFTYTSIDTNMKEGWFKFGKKLDVVADAEVAEEAEVEEPTRVDNVVEIRPMGGVVVNEMGTPISANAVTQDEAVKKFRQDSIDRREAA